MNDADEEAKAKLERKQLRRQRAVERLSPSKPPTSSANRGNASTTTTSSRGNSLNVNHDGRSLRPYESQQILNSKDRLERRKVFSMCKISGYRVNAEQREGERRRQGERRCQERMKHHKRGEEVWSRINQQIGSSWDDCASKASASETKEALEQQQKCCSDFIQSKKDLIQDYSYYRRLHDDDHAASLKDQAETLESLRGTIESELSEMQQSFNEELEAIEEAYIDDRSRLLESTKDELASLVLEKSNMEAHHLKAIQTRRAEGKTDINAARKQGMEEHTELKISLVEQVQKLEQKLEKAKVTHQLNSDRLDYNLRILTERNEEAADIIKNQKKRLVQSKEDFNKSREQYWEAEEKGDKKINDLSKDCRFLDTRWKSLVSKSRRFEQNDEGKYRSLFDMHVDELSALVRRIKQYEAQIMQSLVPVQRNQSNYGDGSHEELEHGDVPVPSMPSIDSDDEEGALTELRNTIDDATYQTWTELEKLLRSYKELLEKQERGSSEMRSIARENAGIRQSLQHISQSEHSKELICPPTMFVEGSKSVRLKCK